MGIAYLERYRHDEPVNKNTFQKKRKVIVGFNLGFFDKIDTDAQIKELPKDLKNVVLLCIVEDKSIKEVAEILNIHRNTVSNRIKKATKILEEIS